MHRKKHCYDICKLFRQLLLVAGAIHISDSKLKEMTNDPIVVAEI